MPKRLRRSTDYLKAVARDFNGNLSDWIPSKSNGSRHESDLVRLYDGTPQAVEVPLSTLIGQRSASATFDVDVRSIAIVEK